MHRASAFPCSRAGRTAAAAIAIVLSALGVLYQGKGHYYLNFGTDRADAVDLHQKWAEHHYFLVGINPYDAWLQHGPMRETETARRTIAARGMVPNLGVPDPASPPWAYLPGVLWFWPPWPSVRTYYSVLNLFAMALVSAWAFAQLKRFGTVYGWLGASAALALGGATTALEVGQYTLVILGLLAGALWALERDRPYLSGVLLAAALAKPTIAAPFVLILVVRAEWRALFALGAFALASSAATYAIVHTSPVEMLYQLSLVGQYLATEGGLSLTRELTRVGVDRRLSTILPAGVIGTALLGALWWCRNQPQLLLAGLAAVAGRLWAYHRGYDDPMLVFALIALLVGTLEKPIIPLGLATLAMFGTLAAPPRFATIPAFELLQVVVWLGSAVTLVMATRVPVASTAGVGSRIPPAA
jgi:hypothetical protein